MDDSRNPSYLFDERDALDLYNSAPCGHVSAASDGLIVAVNQTFLDWTGYRRDDLVQVRRLQDLFTAAGRIFYDTQFHPLLQLQGSIRAVAFDLVCPREKRVSVLLNAVQRKNSAGLAIIHTAIFDATHRRAYERQLLSSHVELEERVTLRTTELAQEVAERKQAEENLRELTGRLLRLRDDEQRRIARGLHDSVGQLVAGIAINQSALGREELSERARDRLKENIEMTEQISTEIRTISHLLHPPLLDEAGLGSALSWYIEGINRRSGMVIAFTMPAEFGRLTAELETALFRIAQECLTNLHRHAACKSADVTLDRDEEFVSLTIADNGHGMSPAKVAEIKSGRSSGVGLRGMIERIRQLHGQLEIASSEEGTRIEVRLPVPVPREL